MGLKRNHNISFDVICLLCLTLPMIQPSQMCRLGTECPKRFLSQNPRPTLPIQRATPPISGPQTGKSPPIFLTEVLLCASARLSLKTTHSWQNFFSSSFSLFPSVNFFWLRLGTPVNAPKCGYLRLSARKKSIHESLGHSREAGCSFASNQIPKTPHLG
jgi:hypothetical protein